MYIRVVSLPLLINVVYYMHGCHTPPHTHFILCLITNTITVFCVRHSFAFVKIAIRADGQVTGRVQNTR
jgi:hypothetical protein